MRGTCSSASPTTTASPGPSAFPWACRRRPWTATRSATSTAGTSANQWQPEPGTDPATRLLCVFRSRLGHPFWAVSADRGATRSRPEVLRLCPGGPPRDPLWIAVGREALGVTENAGLCFARPKVVVYHDGRPGGPFCDFEIGYPRFHPIAARNWVAYANKTSQLRISEVPEALLDDAGLPVA